MIDGRLTDEELGTILQSELGHNALRILAYAASLGSNRVFVDLGVETGKSSKLLLHNAVQLGNMIVGVDPVPTAPVAELITNPRYVFEQNDSVQVGREWNHGPVDLVMFDSIHAKEQVLCELFYWWEHIRDGGVAIFHDTQWEGSIIQPPHPDAGKGLGTSGKGFDVYGGIAWETPDKALLRFFDLPDLNYTDEFIESVHSPESYGMTFVRKRRHKDFKAGIKCWDDVFALRQRLLHSFLHPQSNGASGRTAA